MGGYFFIAMMVYNTMIKTKVMYSTASPLLDRRGKSIPPSNMKGDNRLPYGNACLYYTTFAELWQ